MRYAKLGKLTSTVSLVALLAAAGMSSAQASTPTVTVGVSSSAKMTPHIFEDNIITALPLPPLESGLCGQAGLDPVLPDTSALHYHYEVRNNVVTAVADPGWRFVETITLEQRTFIFNPAYYSCPDPSYLIGTEIEAPCVQSDGTASLPLATDRYSYGYTVNSVLATETPSYLFLQDVVHEWPLAEIVTPCPGAVAPIVAQPAPAPESAPADLTSDVTLNVPGSQAAITPSPTPSTTEPDVEAASTAVDVPLANVGVETATDLPTTLANTGVKEEDQEVMRGLVGLAFALLSAGILVALSNRGYFKRG